MLAAAGNRESSGIGHFLWALVQDVAGLDGQLPELTEVRPTSASKSSSVAARSISSRGVQEMGPSPTVMAPGTEYNGSAMSYAPP